MSGYGKVIDGGAQMRKGVTKGINDKLSGFSAGHERSEKIAGAVRDAFKQRNLADQTTNNVKGGKFQKAKKDVNV